jgi:hypothetical protein
MPNGDYSLKLSLVKQLPGDFNSQEKEKKLSKEIVLTHVTLISSKREVLIDFLRNKNHDWKLLAKTLIVL